MAEHERISSSIPASMKLLAGNALQLQLPDHPDDPFAASHILVAPYPGPSAPLPAGPAAHPDPTLAPASPTLARVRFRSRVRITSGLRHSRRQARSPDSSAESSPSSSISVPLRHQADENNPRGPLGKRISVLAANAWQKRRHTAFDPSRADEERGERTPLTRGSTPRMYGDHGEEAQQESEQEYLARVRREEELAFGKWPWRALNRHVSCTRLSVVWGRRCS
ncbi:hypothetical protein BV25DRAFT_1899482 [Artomyces pyxidatus]|uniref:Uncharacterized protein n=1 Tax=Artomyces pyxidatus TaxID=48021 RepID=A0ACB8T306_9AGAM|nr:hypothetical protein BV25DRAFT_1899482 [Artomyces pyxidatus]